MSSPPRAYCGTRCFVLGCGHEADGSSPFCQAHGNELPRWQLRNLVMAPAKERRHLAFQACARLGVTPRVIDRLY